MTLVVGLAWGAPGAARADDLVHEVWYGDEILIADTLSLLACPAAALGVGQGELIVGCAMGYVFVPPAIHAAHGTTGTAAADLGLRIAAVGVGAVLAITALEPLINHLDESSGESPDKGQTEAVAAVLFFGCTFGATALDAFGLAWAPAPGGEPITAVPMLGPGLTGVGIGGRF